MLLNVFERVAWYKLNEFSSYLYCTAAQTGIILSEALLQQKRFPYKSQTIYVSWTVPQLRASV